tara:strand:- start:316 stop:858 length:543 start_codon:yes stop_codon:yes gene_type:complete
MVTHGMIDLETLGTTQDSVVLTIGAAKFSPFNTNEPTDKLYLKLDTSDQVEKGRIIDEGTLKWWGQQDEEVRKDTFSEHDRICVEAALDTLADWFKDCSKVWCQGPSFDFPMLGHLYRNYDKKQPWNFWLERDSRTVTGLVPEDIKSKINFAAHNAMEDVVAQCKCVQYVFNVLDIQRTF